MNKSAFFNHISLHLIVFRVLTLAPFPPFHEREKTWQKTVSAGYSVCAVVFPILFGFFCDFNGYKTGNNMNTVLTEILFSLSSTIYTFIILSSWLTRGKQFQIIQNVLEIDAIFFNKFAIQLDYGHLKRSLTKKLLTFYLLIQFLLLINFLFTLTNGFRPFTFHQLIISHVIRGLFIQATFYVELLNVRLGLLNKCLLDIANLNTAPLDPDKLAENTVLEHLLTLKIIYAKIWSVIYVYNDTFGWSFILLIGYSFSTITFNCFWIFASYLGVFTNVAPWDCMIVIVGYSVFVVHFIFHVNNCKELSLETIAAIHKLRNVTENKKQEDLVREFYLQLLHEPIVITANGLFKVDTELLGSMVFTAATYLVILMQFQLSDIK